MLLPWDLLFSRLLLLTDLTITERNISNTLPLSFCARVQVQTHTALGVCDLCSLLLSSPCLCGCSYPRGQGELMGLQLDYWIAPSERKKEVERETPLPKTRWSAPSARCRLAASHWAEPRRHISRPCPWLLSPKRRIRRVRRRNTILTVTPSVTVSF